MPAVPEVHIALPALNEAEYISKTLECLKNQTLGGFHTWVCVNQPDNWWQQPEKLIVCNNNNRTLELLKKCSLTRLHIIDRSSPGSGWQTGREGIGMARKVLMDAINIVAQPEDIIVSMDADTVFASQYLTSVMDCFRSNSSALALANPYLHPLTGMDELDRAMLRYEIYMRYYALNMRFAGTPYCFSPLGSAMACRVWAYRKINGLTPKKSGEDFYFLQKMVKAGHVMMYNSETVFPGTRLSERVLFGTGPALIRGIAEGWHRYPLFNLSLFDNIKQTINKFPDLFHGHLVTPMDEFFREQFGEDDIFEPLRRNNPDLSRFIKACHDKVDGLRILQYLKKHHALQPRSDEENLKKFMAIYFPSLQLNVVMADLDFSLTPVKDLDFIRTFLYKSELKIQKENE